MGQKGVGDKKCPRQVLPGSHESIIKITRNSFIVVNMFNNRNMFSFGAQKFAAAVHY